MNYSNAAIEFYKQYSLGKREFHEAQLPRADLSRKILSQVDLRYADLNHANLKKTDLSYADLRQSCLIRAELSGANLTGANLACADLSKVNFALAQLREANLNGACLNKAYLTGTNLMLVDLSYSDLTGTYLIGADLSEANLSGAFYDNDTSFPSNFDPISAGMRQKYTIKELLDRFSPICKCSNRYLGSIMTAKYFHSSRPNFDWLKQFEINKSNQITFEGSLEDSVSPLQLRWFQAWINNFIESCSQIIKDFSQLI